MVVIRPWLLVGKYSDTLDGKALVHLVVQALLHLVDVRVPSAIEGLHIGVEDTEPVPSQSFQRGIDFVSKHRKAGRKVMIICGAGINRSVSFAIAVLKLEEGLSVLDGFLSIRKVHRAALPHPVVWKSLCDHFGEEISLREALAAVRKQEALVK